MSAASLEEVIRELRGSGEAQGLGANALRELIKQKQPALRPTVKDVREALAGVSNVAARAMEYRNERAANTLRHYDEKKPNELHHADLLELPNDRGYRYALVVVDSASRYREAEPLKTKSATAVADAFERLYKRSPLDFPQRMNTDSGKEFMGRVADLMEKHGTQLSRGPPGNHRWAALAEAANRVLAKRLFEKQYEEEETSGETSRTWVRELPTVINTWNRLPTRALPDPFVPAKAITAPYVNHTGPTKKERANLKRAEALPLLAIGTLVRYPLDRPEDATGAFRETDLRFTPQKHKIVDLRILPDRPPEYRAEGSGRWWTGFHLTTR